MAKTARLNVGNLLLKLIPKILLLGRGVVITPAHRHVKISR